MLHGFYLALCVYKKIRILKSNDCILGQKEGWGTLLDGKNEGVLYRTERRTRIHYGTNTTVHYVTERTWVHYETVATPNSSLYSCSVSLNVRLTWKNVRSKYIILTIH